MCLTSTLNIRGMHIFLTRDICAYNVYVFVILTSRYRHVWRVTDVVKCICDNEIQKVAPRARECRSSYRLPFFMMQILPIGRLARE